MRIVEKKPKVSRRRVLGAGTASLIALTVMPGGMIVGAGNLEGQMDVANMIKPELARGRMKVIGATTIGEYHF